VAIILVILFVLTLGYHFYDIKALILARKPNQSKRGDGAAQVEALPATNAMQGRAF
jgi:hypothetical protein